MGFGEVPVERNPALRVHNVNVRIPTGDLETYQELAALAGLSLNKWVLRACRRKAEFEQLLLAEKRAYEEGGFHGAEAREEEV